MFPIEKTQYNVYHQRGRKSLHDRALKDRRSRAGGYDMHLQDFQVFQRPVLIKSKEKKELFLEFISSGMEKGFPYPKC